MADQVYIKGLAEFRRDLRRIDPVLAKGVREGLKDAAQIVAYEARRRAPVRSGRLVASVRAFASGNRADNIARARELLAVPKPQSNAASAARSASVPSVISTETAAGRLDCLDADNFNYTITTKELSV